MKLADPEEQYAKNKLLKREDVQSLREWAEKEAHLPKVTGEVVMIIVEKIVLLIVRACLFIVEKMRVFTLDWRGALSK